MGPRRLCLTWSKERRDQQVTAAAAGYPNEVTCEARGRIDSVSYLPPENAGNRDQNRGGRDEIGHRLGQDSPGSFDAAVLQIVNQRPGSPRVDESRPDPEPALQELVGSRPELVAAVSA